ncbi:HEXXH motif-containing putative peptide modification protein [Nocardia fluminea]|uniref:aKG-HExxH-type peptide beta-hydroxylase n=1 Tax=Nocardia fluminea TaxID=134984 RepID=UPI003660058C
MATRRDSADTRNPSMVAALLGRTHPGTVRDAWWLAEFRFRLDAFARAEPDRSVQDIDSSTVEKVFGHPAVGSIARADPVDSPHAWVPVRAALGLSPQPANTDVIADLRATENWPGASVYLPGTGLVYDTATASTRSLDIVDGLELNNVDRLLVAQSDHVDTVLSDGWSTMVRAAQTFITGLGSPGFGEVSALTTVVVPLLQRDGAAFGRSSRFEIESGSVTDAIGAAFISPGTGEPVSFAEALIHESYHNLFNMALDLHDFAEDDSREFYAPWKGTTRPTRAVLHGIVAFSAVMRFWRRIGETNSDWSEYADEVAGRRAAEVLGAATAVASAAALTDLGTELIEAAITDARLTA